jgi:hypothetical protein
VTPEFRVKTTTELEPREISGLTRLFENVYGKPCPEDLFCRKYAKSWLGHSVHSLMSVGDELAGAFSAIPVRYRYFGRTLLFAITADLMIDPRHRGALSRVKKLSENLYEGLRRQGVAFVFCCLRNEIFQLHQAASAWREIGKVSYYVSPVRFRWLARIGSVSSPAPADGTFAIEKVNDADFEEWRYRIFPAAYRTAEFPGAKAIYATQLYYPIEALPSWVKLGLLIDVFPLTRANFDIAVREIRRQNPELNAIAYQGILPFRPREMVRIPAKYEKQSWTLAGKVLDPNQVDEKIFEAKNWNVNLSNGDLV